MEDDADDEDEVISRVFFYMNIFISRVFYYFNFQINILISRFFFYEQDDEGPDTPSSSGLKKSAAGLCISMGSFSDPLELPGLFTFILTGCCYLFVYIF